LRASCYADIEEAGKMKRSKSFYKSLLEKYRGVADDVEQGGKLATDIDGYRWAKCVLWENRNNRIFCELWL